MKYNSEVTKSVAGAGVEPRTILLQSLFFLDAPVGGEAHLPVASGCSQH